MAEAPLHRLYHHFSELPLSLKYLYTAALLVLGMGYLFALIYLYHTYSAKDGNPLTLTYQDLVIAYTGSGEASRLESALRGSMRSMLPPEETESIIAWAREGAERAKYDEAIRPVFDKRCMSCHDGSNPHIPNFRSYDNVQKLTERDTGTAIFTLVKVSHIHLFGITFIFFIMGTIFSHAHVRPVWLKCAVMAMPFGFLVVDVSSWYFTKLFHPFALVVMSAGAAMGACFAFMWVVSMYQMWFSKTPEAVLKRESGGGVG